VNDEDFARGLLAQAFFPSAVGEPGMSLDPDQIVRDGRRQARARRVGVVTGGTALAGVVGLAAWGAAGLGSGGVTTSVGPGAGSDKPSASSSQPVKINPRKGVPCTGPTVPDLGAIVKAALPAGVEATTGPSSCLDAGGTRVITTLIQLARPKGSLTVEVDTAAGSEAPAPSTSGNASKAARALGSTPSTSAERAKASAAKSAHRLETPPSTSCQPASPSGTVCVTAVTKDQTHATVVTLSPTTSRYTQVQLIAGGDNDGSPAPLSGSALVEIAEAVAAQG
jgi:hypothetical protein